MIKPPYPGLQSILTSVGEAGRRLSEIEAAEGAAGNISVFVRWPLNAENRFSQVQAHELPLSVPELSQAAFIVTGSGRRLREVMDDPEGNVGCLLVEAGGRTAQLYTSPRRQFEKLTSEFESHLAVHYEQVISVGTNFHAIVHAQPPYLTYLSHIAAYQEGTYLNRHLLRWQPETILQIPEGIGLVPFLVPGSSELALATRESMKRHRLVLWSRHGVMARSDSSLQHAVDLIEYAEAAARYEYMNLVAPQPSEGLSPEEIRAICKSARIEQDIF